MTTNIDWLAVARKAAEDTIAAVDGLEAALTPVKVGVELPTEPKTLWADNVGDVWLVDYNGKLVCLTSGPLAERCDEETDRTLRAEVYAPFTRLAPEADTAKKVIDEILNWAIRNEAARDEAHYIVWEKSLHRIAAEFGVTL